MWMLYQFAVALLLTIAAPILLVFRGAHYLPTLPGRLGGHRGRVVRSALWMHAVSVGEVAVAMTVLSELREATPSLPLLVTTVTPTGQERARAALEGRAGLRERSAAAFLPFDLGFAIARFQRRFAPSALILVEGDYWPLLLSGAKREGLPVLVVNGRMSDRSFRSLARVRPLARRLLAAVDHFGMQTAGDREKLLRLGVGKERITVTGNLKFESPEPPRSASLEERLAELAGGRPVLMAGSTMAGEEERVLAAFRRLGSGERAMLVLAPRHPERWDEVDRLARRGGFDILRRSRCEEAATGSKPDLLLLDSLGELAGLYAAADGAFIGGTLVPTGGHNPVEAARWEVPIATGPSMDNFREMAELFDEADAWERAADPEDLAKIWASWIDRPERARKIGRRGARLVEANRGALEATLRLLAPAVRTVIGEGDGKDSG